ncbi:Tubulinyl-Tyr carboxypeptidase 2 [Irineochytrium annulatum]|nr:Tubulinyl-Tyr carboxypeptidase 2 [Irineochytrium annulatum]
MRKNLPFKQLMGTAAEMVRYGLPIKCLEAAVVGIYCSNEITEIDRFTLSFKSKAEGSVFRHIVLAIRHHEYYGALGLSRRKDLMFKPLVYRSLRELVMEYKRAYGNNFHELTKIKIGLPCPHDPANHELLPWKFKSVVMDGDTWSRELDEIDYLVQKRRKA